MWRVSICDKRGWLGHHGSVTPTLKAVLCNKYLSLFRESFFLLGFRSDQLAGRPAGSSQHHSPLCLVDCADSHSCVAWLV